VWTKGKVPFSLLSSSKKEKGKSRKGGVASTLGGKNSKKKTGGE